MLTTMRALCFVLLTAGVGTAAAECELPLPAGGAKVGDYLMQINRSDERSIAAQVHVALHDLVEYSPMGCGDAEPDDSYRNFTIRSAVRDERDCRWLRLAISPANAAVERAPTPLLCTPSTVRGGGWACRFVDTDTRSAGAP